MNQNSDLLAGDRSGELKRLKKQTELFKRQEQIAKIKLENTQIVIENIQLKVKNSKLEDEKHKIVIFFLSVLGLIMAIFGFYLFI